VLRHAEHPPDGATGIDEEDGCDVVDFTLWTVETHAEIVFFPRIRWHDALSGVRGRGEANGDGCEDDDDALAHARNFLPRRRSKSRRSRLNRVERRPEESARGGDRDEER
jgi:hypothetical protein